MTEQVLPTLIACCKPGNCVEDRVEGAQIIAYLTELDVGLQQQASITDHCLLVLSTYFNESTTPNLKVRLISSSNVTV